MNAPQYVMIVLLFIETLVHTRRLYRIAPDEPVGNVFTTMIRISGISGVLYWGGFWS